MSIQNNDTDVRIRFPFLRGLELLKRNSSILDQDKSYGDLMKKRLEKMKEVDETGKNQNGIINFDKLMSLLLKEYKKAIDRTKEYVKTAFRSADLDGNNFCSKNEFLILWQYICPETFDREKGRKIFIDSADEIEAGGQAAMRFERFSVVCVENQLFMEKDQLRFLEIKSLEEADHQLKVVKTQWNQKRAFLEIILKDQISKEQTRSQREKVEQWQEILMELDKRFIQKDTKLAMSILISLKILELEVVKYLEVEKKKNEEKANVEAKKLMDISFSVDSFDKSQME